jgi:DNA replication and repair protein RecF
MRLTKLEISGVRNLTSIVIDCAPDLNLFVGPNGAGKTALLEGLYLLCRGQSFRSKTVAPVMRRDADALMVRTELEDEHRGRIACGMVKHRSGRTELHVNGVVERRLSEMARLMPVQLILPNSSDLVFGGPVERRRFIDWGTFHVEPSYLEQLRSYQRVLQQRNAFLRSHKSQRPESFQKEFESWTTQLVALGSVVDATRRTYLDTLIPAVLSQLEGLSPEIRLAISYRSGWRQGASLEECLRDGVARDVTFGLTHSGPHRGDLRLSVEGDLAAATLSRGQGKMVASALRLAQAEVTSQIAGRKSVFLIDDVGAELDAAHNERFFVALAATGSQVLATATSPMTLGSAFAGCGRRLFHVEQGSCHPFGTRE